MTFHYSFFRGARLFYLRKYAYIRLMISRLHLASDNIYAPLYGGSLLAPTMDWRCGMLQSSRARAEAAFSYLCHMAEKAPPSGRENLHAAPLPVALYAITPDSAITDWPRPLGIPLARGITNRSNYNFWNASMNLPMPSKRFPPPPSASSVGPPVFVP